MNAVHKRRSSIVGIVLCWVALVAMMACNFLFEFLELGGVTSSEVSNQVFAWFTPAGYVFSIWSAIYAALVIWMILESSRAADGRSLTPLEVGLFVVTCALNVGWLVAFHFQQIELALIVMVALWASMLVLYMNLRDDPTRNRFNLIPFSLYFGWLTVAMIANATNLATRMFDAPLLANQVSTVVLTLAVLVVAFLSARNSRDYVFPLVILWATVGIGVRLMNVDMLVSAAVLALSAVGALAIYIPGLLAANRAPARRPLASED
ncbi:MAG: tryptophan-rich sensory protein [Eggerthellaceae bacterium]|nr:tryptophan-rich sensory protein [Eggerthellaceae bacterium]